MPADHSSSDFDDFVYDLRSQAIRARLYACLLGPQDEASERLLAFADDLETRADAAERASIAPLPYARLSFIDGRSDQRSDRGGKLNDRDETRATNQRGGRDERQPCGAGAVRTNSVLSLLVFQLREAGKPCAR